jgi:hypothetical protein
VIRTDQTRKDRRTFERKPKRGKEKWEVPRLNGSRNALRELEMEKRWRQDTNNRQERGGRLSFVDVLLDGALSSSAITVNGRMKYIL